MQSVERIRDRVLEWDKPPFRKTSRSKQDNRFVEEDEAPEGRPDEADNEARIDSIDIF